jgi:riboflavin biosynthesis pyrimidine reductase
LHPALIDVLSILYVPMTGTVHHPSHRGRHAMTVITLYPPGGDAVPLEGLHLRERLPASFIYSNFVASIDGRIAVAQCGRRTHAVPAETANPRDWRLYQELAAQADLLLISARLLRQMEIDEAQDQMPIGPKFDDLRRWRIGQRLPAQPDIAVLSGSLDLPVAILAKAAGERRVMVVTGVQAPEGRKAILRDAGIEVIEAGEGARVAGGLLREALAKHGARRIYSVAGPQVLHMLLADRVLDRLYLTLAGRVLGGTEFDTLCFGPALDPAPKLSLRHLHLDTEAPAGAGQLLAAYDLDYG